jgi:hypothetical protein
MIELVLFNLALIVAITVALFLVKRYVKTKRGENITLLVAATVTILFHYSTFLFYAVTGGDAMGYLKDNANLLMPIYPCNLVMWSCLILALIRKEDSRLKLLLTDYIFWFGIISTLVGMFANVDFINNPTLAVYDTVKSIAAHGTLLFNVLLLAIFGRIKMDFGRNMKNIFISVVLMYVIGLYLNLVFEVLVSYEAAYDVNSMFIIHSPFAALSFLKYPLIALIGLILYFILFTLCDALAHEKGRRFVDRAGAFIKDKTAKLLKK